mmetsp:Transcript_41158/g.86332  ORF Transcript_41158/g.86332 Transcript_41158/m.86332 type:complete len:510 (-) Transcript_41158:3-1532(-)
MATMVVSQINESMPLPADGNGENYGVLCHRQYADRIREALLPPDGNWLKLASSTGTHPVKPSSQPNGIIDNKYTVIPTREEKGPRKSRTGYSLLVFRGAVMSPVDLPPMARKQISWAGRVSHQLILNGVNGGAENNSSVQSTVKSLSREIWMKLKQSFDEENGFLRIDVQPKSFNTEVCAIFTDVANETTRNPIKMACSASKVSHVVNIIIQSTSSSDTEPPTAQTIFWGISNNGEHFERMNQRLNDYATNEVVMEGTCAKTGIDEGENVPWDAPVSRAYYKLAQVFEDDQLLQLIASPRNKSENSDVVSPKSILSHGSGLDLGASPGGWTQVLRSTLCVPNVVTIDPGILAHRVMSLKGIHHVRAELSSEESVKALARHAPYSVIVCDASVSNANELLVKIAETFDGVSSLLKKSVGSNGETLDGKNFAWPLCLVVTLKLPYKTHGSIDRNLEKVNGYIPEYLRRIASSGSPSGGDNDLADVEISYKICHLFANSAAERTLIAIFHKK